MRKARAQPAPLSTPCAVWPQCGRRQPACAWPLVPARSAPSSGRRSGPTSVRSFCAIGNANVRYIHTTSLTQREPDRSRPVSPETGLRTALRSLTQAVAVTPLMLHFDRRPSEGGREADPMSHVARTRCSCCALHLQLARARTSCLCVPCSTPSHAQLWARYRHLATIVISVPLQRSDQRSRRARPSAWACKQHNSSVQRMATGRAEGSTTAPRRPRSPRSAPRQATVRHHSSRACEPIRHSHHIALVTD